MNETAAPGSATDPTTAVPEPTGSAGAVATPAAGGSAIESAGEQPGKPALRDRTKPIELLVISAACGIFAGFVTLLVTRDWLLTGVMFGVAFIIGLVVLAMLSLGGYEVQQPPSKDGVLRDNERKQDSGH